MKLYLLQEEIDTGFLSIVNEAISIHKSFEGAEVAMQKLENENNPHRPRFYRIDEVEVLD